jgi:hypothetical protein
MNAETLASHARITWEAIAAASTSDRSRLYWAWCKTIIIVEENGDLTIREAANLLIWPESLDDLDGLGGVADILMLLETADAIVEGDAYIGAPDNEVQDWQRLVECVNGHTSQG